MSMAERPRGSCVHTEAGTGISPGAPDGWMKEAGNVCAMEYYSAIKKQAGRHLLRKAWNWRKPR